MIQASGKTRPIVFDALLISAGLVVSSLGIALFYAAGLGSAPMSTFCDGLHLVFGVSYGTANTIANIILLVVLLLIKRSYINVGTLLCVFTIGPYINWFASFLELTPVADAHIVFRVALTVCGTVLLGLGLGFYVAVDRGYGALEGIIKYACEKWALPYALVKVGQDILLVTLGMALGAAWGIGTVIAMLLTGPVLQASIRQSAQLLGRARRRSMPDAT